jgi:hypothetical protein
MNDTNQGELLSAGEASPPLAAPPDQEQSAVTEFAPSGCSNSPLGNPIYPERPDISPPNDPGTGDGTKVLLDLDRAWPIGQEIIVKFLNGQNDPWVRHVHQRVQEIAPTWCDYANLTMRFVNDGPCHMTVNFVPSGQFGYGVFNCWLGTDCFRLKNQVQSMNLIFDPRVQQAPADFRESEFHRLILHEFGHALAMQHEHQRADRPIVWVQRLFDVYQQRYGWGPDMVRQQVVRIENLTHASGTVFDEFSIMMYQYPEGVAFYQKEGAPPNTPDVSRPFVTGNNTKLTALDKVAAAVTYPKPGAPRIGEETLRAGQGARTGRLTAAGQVAPFVFKPTAAGDYTIIVGGPMPALVGLMRERGGRDSRGSLANIQGAAESTDQQGASLTLRNASANTEYFVEVRHAKPMRKPDSGDFTIVVRQGA